MLCSSIADESVNQASLFSKRYDVAMVTPPSPGIFYHCLLGDSPMALARICALISRYHETFSDLKKQSGDRSDVFSFENYKPSRGFTNGLENSRLLNGYIIDMSSSLWVTVKLNRQKEQDMYGEGLCSFFLLTFCRVARLRIISRRAAMTFPSRIRRASSRLRMRSVAARILRSRTSPG